MEIGIHSNRSQIFRAVIHMFTDKMVELKIIVNYDCCKCPQP